MAGVLDELFAEAITKDGLVVDTVLDSRKVPTVKPSPFRKQLQPITKALHKYGCLLLPLPEQLSQEIITWAQAIPDNDLGPGGRELEPHLTLKYGFTDDSPEAIQILRALLVRHGPITVQLKEVSLFKNNEDGDVLKIDVDSQELHELNAAISSLVHTEDKYPTYQPHVTIAYLKPAVAEQYLAGTFPFLGKTIMLDRAQYARADGTSVDISLSFMGGDGLRTVPPKALPTYHSKGEGEPCEQGETAAQSGCIPATGEGHKKPSTHPPTVSPTPLKRTEEDKHKVVRSEAFKNWFGDWENDPDNASKVVDTDTGEPKETHTAKVVYHGRPVKFDVFSKDKNKATEAGSGFYFAENREIAETFASLAEDSKGDVLSAYLSIKNPFNFDARITMEQVRGWAEAVKAAGFKAKTLGLNAKAYFNRDASPDGTVAGYTAWVILKDTVGVTKANEVLAAVGHDGIVHTAGDLDGQVRRSEKQKDLGKVWVAFEPNQIKSTDNEGTFDPNTDHIGKSLPPFFKQDWLKLTAEQAARLARNEAIRLGRPASEVQQVGNVVFEHVHVHTTNRGAIYQRELLRHLNAGKSEEEARRLADLAARGLKDLSYLSQTRGGDLVSPVKQRSRLGSRTVKKPRLKSLFYYRKGEGEPCEQGETAAQSGCVPASGEGHKKPVGSKKPSGKNPKTKPDISIDENYVGKPAVVDHIADWDRTSTAGTSKQKVQLEKAKYTIPVGPDNPKAKTVTVYRWASSNAATNIVSRRGKWTLDKTEAIADGLSFASDQSEEKPKESKPEEEKPKESKPEEEKPKKPKLGEYNRRLPDQARPQLEDEEAEAITWFTTSGFIEFNSALRKDDELEPDEVEKDELLQRAFAKVGRFAKPVRTYRGLSLDSYAADDFIDQVNDALESGSSILFKGYQSTTTDRETADNFAATVLFEIDALSGLDAKAFSEKPSEEEMLMNRDQKFEVVSVDEDPVDFRYTVRLRHIL